MSEIEKLSELEKQVLLAMTMESIRGSWNDPEERLFIINTLCNSIKELPIEYLNAVKHNASEFDGEYIDGRIFRDGSRSSGLSGNLAYMITGDDRVNQGGFYGTYNELWDMLKNILNLEDIKKMVACVLEHTSDCTWNEYYDEVEN